MSDMKEEKPMKYGIHYVQGADGILYPDQDLDEGYQPVQLGELGTLAKAWLEEKKPLRYHQMLYNGKLMGYLLHLEEQMMARFSVIEAQLKEAEPAPSPDDTLAMMQYGQQIYQTAKELVIEEFLEELNHDNDEA